MNISRIVAPAFGIAWANLGLLGLLIGQVGASRAYSVGLHTLFRDHLWAVLAACVAGLMLAALAAWRLTSVRDLVLLFTFVLLADVVAGLLVIAGFGEIRLVDLPRVLVTETAMGTQLLAVGAGGFIGYLARPRMPTSLEA
jgi:hypothetical protein